LPEENVFTFPAGILGLSESLTRFELIPLEENSPFFFLQSVQDEDIGFILINPFAFFPDYEFELPDEEAAALQVKEPEKELAVFCIVNAREGLSRATVNLLAPVVVNTAARTARQVVLQDRRYGLRHPLPRPKPLGGGPSSLKDPAPGGADGTPARAGAREEGSKC